jgi:hypothetical protein
MPGIAARSHSPELPGAADLHKPRDDGKGSAGGGGKGGGDRPTIDPIIGGLLARLPKSGDVWPESERTLWLDLLKGSFKLIYKDKPDAVPTVEQMLK